MSEYKWNLAFGIATRGHDISADLLLFLTGCPFPIIMSKCNYSAAIAQEQVFQGALENNNDLLFLDSDVTPTKDIIQKLINANKDIVVAPVYHYDSGNKEIHVDATTTGERNYEMKYSGLERIIGSSFSCMLIKHSALKKFKDANEAFTNTNLNIDNIHPIVLKDDFRTIITSDGVFFSKCRGLGIEVYVCWDAQGCIHTKPIDLCTETIKKLRASKC